MNNITQFRLIARTMSAAIRINQIRIGSIAPLIADCSIFGESGGSLHITIHSHKRPVGDLEAQRKAALFHKYIDLSGDNAEQELNDAIATLETFVNDGRVAA